MFLSIVTDYNSLFIKNPFPFWWDRKATFKEFVQFVRKEKDCNVTCNPYYNFLINRSLLLFVIILFSPATDYFSLFKKKEIVVKGSFIIGFD